jgi:ATP-dependent Clp protease ATP-binding subunit ClpA
MFERFHPDARAAVMHARDEATRSGQREVGTEHLLLGLLARPGHAADALTAAGVDAADLRARIPRGDAARPWPLDAEALASGGIDPDSAQRASDAALGADSPERVRTEQRGGRGVTDDTRMTRDAKRALEFALRAAQRLKHQHVSSGHVLLGIIDQPGTPAVQALTVAGIHVGMLRADVLRRMAAGADPG